MKLPDRAPGTRAREERAFASEVQVRRRVALPAAAPLNGLGAVFVTMDDRSRNSLVAFLRKASQ